ncbi:NADH dehydrogenase [ubiquinone] 1 beta subcomplex subunit 5, mitochondrial [Agrilus planipennis]|uniref:NADH dehydrogenase [ubiquinone] 1 beta subcomplex subunit 5, mitochondrial n=1 Tax=Agrilus planipennis TaxID=224129 RepID=A0A1W4WJ00_AGRPL|nr:NADH dehydrogenase [ubiquinone] 1 beta subcomplex subunit 5, mitochondrial [Agrilus planipennis]
MVVWSSLRNKLFQNNSKILQELAKRKAGDHHVFPLQPSRWQWHKFKDYLHLYVMLGVIPLSLITLYANIFIGPATLSEIPSGYVPYHWEYYRSPVTRFFARYIFNNPQQDYEKYLHLLFEEDEKRKLRRIDNKMKEKIKERLDYNVYYYRPVLGKYHRLTRQLAEENKRMQGD